MDSIEKIHSRYKKYGVTLKDVTTAMNVIQSACKSKHKNYYFDVLMAEGKISNKIALFLKSKLTSELDAILSYASMGGVHMATNKALCFGHAPDRDEDWGFDQYFKERVKEKGIPIRTFVKKVNECWKGYAQLIPWKFCGNDDTYHKTYFWIHFVLLSNNK